MLAAGAMLLGVPALAPATFALTGILVLAVLPAARRERKAVSG
jgi:hypothetical protein